jgi:PAS domain S-box-containing protein
MSGKGVRKKQKHGRPTAKHPIDAEVCSGELARSLFNFSPDAMFLEYLDGKIIDCNEAACKMLGYKKDELLKMKADKLVPEEDARTIFPKIVKDLLSTGTAVLESQNIRKDKTVILVEAHFKLLQRNEKPIVFVVVRDVSRYKEIEKQISEEKEKIEHYLRVAGAMILVLDKRGTITLINKKGNEILGYKNGELVGKNWFTACLSTEDREEVRGVFKKCIEGKLKLVEHYENHVVTKDGEKK